jgi:hypothetical protein
LSSIYLLNIDIYQLQLPGAFHSGKEAIVYIDDRCLLVFGNNGTLGDFEVFIYPKIK